jgi:hypothetical protein
MLGVKQARMPPQRMISWRGGWRLFVQVRWCASGQAAAGLQLALECEGCSCWLCSVCVRRAWGAEAGGQPGLTTTTAPYGEM